MFRSSYWAILPLLAMGGVLLWGLFIYNDNSKKDEPKAKPEISKIRVTPAPVVPVAIKSEENSQSSSESSKEATVKEATTTSREKELLSKYQIKVLNGTEIKGEASRVRDFLIQEGYSISLIGNAEDSTYKETSIQVNKSVPSDFIKQLKDVLIKELILSEGIKVKDSKDSDVVITIGSSKTSN